jgi:hypothetical protein
MTLVSSSWSKSARRMRTRRPTCSAGSFPASIHYLDFWVIPIALVARVLPLVAPDLEFA